MAKGFSLADQLFNSQKVAYLSGLFVASDPGFDGPGFERAVMARLGEFELKARIDWIAKCLVDALPDGFDMAGAAIISALPAPCDPGLSDDDFGDFIFAPLGEYVVQRGMDTPEFALDVLAEITTRFSMEYAIRPFINTWPDITLARLEIWATHPHYHVRRLVSEGTRPKLPWGMKINTAPGRGLPFLDMLYGDKTRFVTRSVANHLNDISKIDPGAVMDRLDIWADGGAQTAKELAWVRNHALRGLIKLGDVRALGMLGYRRDAAVELRRFDLDKTEVLIGDQLRFEIALGCETECPVLVDYIIHYRRAGGLAPKVKKLKQGVIPKGGVLNMVKSYRFPRDATTVKVMPGMHKIEIQVNGRVLGMREFDVVDG